MQSTNMEDRVQDIMQFKEVSIKEIQHEHPLIPENLQLMHQNYVEDDDDFEDSELIEKQKFNCVCNMCGLGIDWYHRYYYKCSKSSCHYSLHKSCAEISTTLNFSAHPSHILYLKKVTTNWHCSVCFTYHEAGMCYHCSTCNYVVDLPCATIGEQKTIHHPGHPHPLTSDIANPALSMCCACGKEQEGDFYNCTTCFNFSIHVDCLSNPIKLSVKSHCSHMLTLSYSFSDQLYGCECRICEREIFNEYWLYKCSKCMFYAHLDCAIQDRQQLPDYEPLEKHSSDYHTPCNFPLPDEAYNILPSQVREWKTSQYFDQTRNQDSHLKHFSHKHPLELKNSGLDSMSLHNPMKRVKLICNGCVRPITTIPFYKCSQEKECSNFVLHEWCARLRTEVQVDPHIHPHRLTLGQRDSMFCCNICSLPCNGFAYGCGACRYYVDVNCALVPYYITHEAHPHHKLMRIVVTSWSSNMSIKKLHACHACRNIIDRGDIFYKCGVPGCDFSLDQLCALRLPRTVRHKIDKHILKLSYSPIENHRGGEYFCEVCEEELNPYKWFYHCSECAYSIHSACAPLILQSEQDVNSSFEDLVYKFVNTKFDGVHKIGDHAHSVTFVAGTKNDGECTKCRQGLQSKIIFRCLQCKFAIHNYCESSITYQVKEELVEMFENLEKKREPKLKPQPQRAVIFFPKKLTRPVTR